MLFRSYLLKNADFVSGLSYDTAYPQSDSYSSVPFVEMILHGISDYTLTPVNLADDSETAFLKSLEYGAIPSYEWYCSKTGKSELDEKYSYENQLNSAAEKYQTADSVLGNLRNARRSYAWSNVVRLTYLPPLFCAVPSIVSANGR